MKNAIVMCGVLAMLSTSPVALAGDVMGMHVVKTTIARTAPTEFDGNDLAVDELLKIAFDESDESLRIAATQVMGDFGTPRARAALGIVLYKNSMGTVRAAAADQLGQLGDGESVYALALAMESERDVEVRDVIKANLDKALPNVELSTAVARAGVDD